MQIRTVVVSILAAALTALAAVACSPAPFNAGSDCPKEPNCGQCASRGGCGWCGDQCMAVGAPACAGSWVKSPDQCPAPTPSVVAAAPPAR